MIVAGLPLAMVACAKIHGPNPGASSDAAVAGGGINALRDFVMAPSGDNSLGGASLQWIGKSKNIFEIRACTEDKFKANDSEGCTAFLTVDCSKGEKTCALLDKGGKAIDDKQFTSDVKVTDTARSESQYTIGGAAVSLDTHMKYIMRSQTEKSGWEPLQSVTSPAAPATAPAASLNAAASANVAAPVAPAASANAPAVTPPNTDNIPYSPGP